ncbi:ATPase [Anaerococcus sp. AGMB00486]|uniref:ATPase n=2 Tax=Anaerococcus TaxID=165779 RepID=A0ABX2N752_9FIRM|nr:MULTISPECIES: ATP synthase subunit C [Anaerococcus]MDY3007170.1 ATP synthase subunit C [Anaerococcus porci]MSS76993.1 ATPase [Anaerococcus porci]NVF10518.1 ATPase [Anaerococcus faecalis]
MILVTILALLCVTMTIYSGLYLMKNNEDPSKEKIKKALKINLSTFVPIMVMILVLILPDGVKAAANGNEAMAASGLKYIGAALSTGLATIGTGYAVGQVGSAALGAISEDASILGRTIIFVGLAEGIAIFGVIISILILYA